MLESANRTMECLGELLAWRPASWRMASEAGLECGRPFDQYLREEMLLRREVVVQGAQRDIGFLGHVLDLDAFVFVALQQRESGVDDALTPCELIICEEARRYRFGHVSLVPEAFSRASPRRSVTTGSRLRRWLDH